ncbi:hypothetical protein SAMN05216251_1254 [Actinacidiphila alni]|uniref:Uncharacterized protein n=1 Tax=Actinacidiphila alni TaxID=380248 RepID=A0A1I2KZ53_9ACTN|nr:hypothetical protein SAMN05216251_1254 [Actinacidiphila alni]
MDASERPSQWPLLLDNPAAITEFSASPPGTAPRPKRSPSPPPNPPPGVRFTVSGPHHDIQVTATTASVVNVKAFMASPTAE